jgi:LacI family transcriptional regulator
VSETPPPPTLKQIARQVGLTTAAVSFALRGDPSIPPRTCKRVREAAEELGYKPDPELGRLMSYLRRHRSVRNISVLGLLSLHPERSTWRENSFLRRLHAGVARRAAGLGYQTEEFFIAASKIPPRRMRDILVTRGIKALVVVDGPVRVDTIGLELDPFATVTIGYGINLPLHRVCQHQYQEMLRVLRRLGDAGYRRPGLVLETETDERTHYHYTSAFASAHRFGLETTVPVLCQERITAAAFTRWVRGHAPDVIIGQSSPAALHYTAWLSHLGLGVPGDIGLVALDVDTEADHQCSGIVQDYEHVAAAAVELVASEVRCGEKGLPATPKVLLIEGRWQDGGTIRPERHEKPRNTMPE